MLRNLYDYRSGARYNITENLDTSFSGDLKHIFLEYSSKKKKVSKN